jgi:hypothetical protein
MLRVLIIMVRTLFKAAHRRKPSTSRSSLRLYAETILERVEALQPQHGLQPDREVPDLA